MKKPPKPQSTYEPEIGDQRFRKLFEKEYGELVISELIIAMMAEDAEITGHRSSLSSKTAKNVRKLLNLLR